MTVNGEHGASAMRMIAPASGHGRREHPFAAARMVSSSCTTRVGRQAAVLPERFIEPRVSRHAHAKRERLLDLDVDRVLEAGRKRYVMVGGRQVQPESRSSVSAIRVARRKGSGVIRAQIGYSAFSQGKSCLLSPPDAARVSVWKK